jgi:hypothetical protein
MPQSTTASLLEYSGSDGLAALEPEFHTQIDMGKVRLHVTLPSAETVVVPFDHRQQVADLQEEVGRRCDCEISALRVRTRAGRPVISHPSRRALMMLCLLRLSQAGCDRGPP